MSEHAGSDAAHAGRLRIAGSEAAPSRTLPMALLRWLSGLALLQALQRLLLALLLLRRNLELELRDEALWVCWRMSFFGRTVRSKEARYELGRVTGAFRRARFARLRRAAGVLSLSIGVLLGGYMVFDGMRGDAPALLWLGALVIALGAAVDLAVNVFWTAQTARVDVQVDLRGAPSLRIGRVARGEADRLLEALTLRLAQAGR